MDDVKEKPVTQLNKSANDRCSDYDNECVDVRRKLKCWMCAPELGICPFLNNEKE